MQPKTDESRRIRTLPSFHLRMGDTLMKKLVLKLGDLRVETFTPAGHVRGRAVEEVHDDYTHTNKC